MFDGAPWSVPASARDEASVPWRTSPSLPADDEPDPLAAPLSLPPGASWRFLGFGTGRNRHGRPAPCGFHLVFLPGPDPWTHLYRAVPGGRGGARLLLLEMAVPGDARVALASGWAPADGEGGR
ncbi:hypothetical protein [Rhizosaccharibacter radicis]|uniref:Uncharacterized protein n=1 Tax=Rhizosaccharibacter radicis TaxID=2782605 RepID=A0ABT1W1H2_9PROT|nr:hypothetical protein [Acetobacteraceae bacterium KSS12]